MSVLLNHYKNYILNNWPRYKDNPFIIFFSGYFKPNKSKSISDSSKENLFKWFWNLSKTFFKYLIAPIQYIIKIITKILGDFTTTLNKFRYQAKIIRKMFADIVESVANKMNNNYAAIKYYQAKLRDITSRQKAIFQIALYFADSMRLTLESLIQGPVMGLTTFFPTFGMMLLIEVAICTLCIFGGPFTKLFTCPICLVCFDKNTYIKLDNNQLKKIYTINIGEKCALGGHVEGILKFKIKDHYCDIYNYKNIIVSGSHMVIEKDKPIRVAESQYSKKINKNPDYLYCLITKNRRLMINNIEFYDFFESNNSINNKKNNLMITNALNNIKIDYLPENVVEKEMDYHWCFAPSVKVSMNNGTYKNIYDIKIDDILKGENLVYGIVKFCSKNIVFYSINDNIISGNQLVKYKKKWIRVHTYPGAVKVKYTHPYAYSIVTKTHQIDLKNNLSCRDYLELREDHPVFDIIHKENQLIST